MTRLPWGHICVLLNKLDDRPTREWADITRFMHARGVEPSEEPVDATGGLEEEIASLARVERQVTRFAARRASELKGREGRGDS